MILAMCSLLEKGFSKRFLCFLPRFFSVGNRVFNLFAPEIGVSTGSADDFEVFPAAFSLWIWVLKRNHVRRKYYHDVMSPTSVAIANPPCCYISTRQNANNLACSIVK